MSWKDELSYLIHPDARKKGAASYYTLNMQEENARDTFEALFCYMGEKMGDHKSLVSNWTLGNEVNSCRMWTILVIVVIGECGKLCESVPVVVSGSKKNGKYLQSIYFTGSLLEQGRRRVFGKSISG